MKSDQLDSAIDEVARQMTEAHPAGAIDFRRRVLARLESGRDHTAAPPRRWSAALVMSTLAVAAAIVIGIAVFRGGSSKSVSQVSVAPATEIPVAQAFRPAVAVTATPAGQALTAAAAQLAPRTGAIRATRAWASRRSTSRRLRRLIRFGLLSSRPFRRSRSRRSAQRIHQGDSHERSRSHFEHLRDRGRGICSGAAAGHSSTRRRPGAASEHRAAEAATTIDGRRGAATRGPAGQRESRIHTHRSTWWRSRRQTDAHHRRRGRADGLHPIAVRRDGRRCSELLADGKIRLGFNLQYDWPAPIDAADRTPPARGTVVKTTMHDSVSLILESGKSMIAAQSADPIGDRQVTVEVKATILR